jgi:hypothetical protein
MRSAQSPKLDVKVTKEPAQHLGLLAIRWGNRGASRVMLAKLLERVPKQLCRSLVNVQNETIL